MNPRGEAVPHAVRARPLLRRGMPYGEDWCGKADGKKRGILGQFFCASIEDQFEHLVAQWGDRVPIGSADRGGARDPLTGAHAAGDGAFEIPLGEKKRPLRLAGLRPFTRALGVAYPFYPSLPVLEGMIAERPGTPSTRTTVKKKPRTTLRECPRPATTRSRPRLRWMRNRRGTVFVIWC